MLAVIPQVWGFIIRMASTNIFHHLKYLASQISTGCGVMGTKLKRFLPKNQHTQRKLLNFENWVSGEVSKSAKN